MIWKKCQFKKKTSESSDALGNPIIVWANGLLTQARYTPWTAAQIALEGREVTSNEQRFVVPKPYSSVEEYKDGKFVIEEVEYDITEIINVNPRFTIVQGKVYKK